jgi:hypothetical protein
MYRKAEVVSLLVVQVSFLDSLEAEMNPQEMNFVTCRLRIPGINIQVLSKIES